MSFFAEKLISITTDSSGDSTDFTESAVFGLLYGVHVSNGDLAATADITLSYTNSDAISVTLLTLTNVSGDTMYYPRHQVHNNVGTGLTLEGTQIAFDLPLIAGKVKVVTAQGGASKAGEVRLYVLED